MHIVLSLQLFRRPCMLQYSWNIDSVIGGNLHDELREFVIGET